MPLVPLSPIDHVFTGRGAYPIEFVFAYDGAIDAGRLEESLRRVLEVFPPVASRFVRVSDDTLAFEPREGGCPFRVAGSATGFAETGRRTVFLDPVDGREGEPLGRVLLTRTGGRAGPPPDEPLASPGSRGRLRRRPAGRVRHPHARRPRGCGPPGAGRRHRSPRLPACRARIGA